MTGCGRRGPQVVPQVAVLRFENLSADPALEWMGRGFSEILAGELAGTLQRGVIQFPSLHAFDSSLGPRPAAPGISTERTGALVAGANQAIYGYFSVTRGTLEATAVEEDLATQQMIRTATARGPAGGGIFPLADALARQMGAAESFDTRSTEALQAYAAALDASVGGHDPAAVARDFAQAIAADPDFGRAWVLWLDTTMTGRDRAGADRIAAQARLHANRFAQPQRAALDLDAALLRGDFRAQIQARRELARLNPANPNHHRALAETLMGVRDYTEAIVEFRRTLALRPDDLLALNSMGYAAAFSGDLPTAIRVLRGYEQLRPKEPNPLDSLGDVHFVLGHFAEAEQFYLAAHTRSPAFLNGGTLLKAAQARLMTGDIAGANALFGRYAGERRAARDPDVALQAAEWQWATGARRAAVGNLERLAANDARVDTQLALWWLELDDGARAAEHARKAVAEATPASAAVSSLIAFLAGVSPPPSPPVLNEYARAYALLFAKQFQPAAPALEHLYAQPTGELDNGLSLLLAWAYVETGQWQKAEPLLRLTPLPQAVGLPVLYSLYFPRLFWLRGVTLDKEGRRRESAAYFALFRKLSGPDATIWRDVLNESGPG
ncbi:MAG TPA: hypothetical protein VMI94_00370 [Bryobacteraceae bacterium]|nr:hypothetical protein [Bryobacteraceae bacterium]